MVDKVEDTGFSRWLKSFMKQHKIRQYQLAERAGVHDNIIQGYRSGRNMPNLYNAAIVATALHQLTGISRAEILDLMAAAALQD